MNRNQRRGRIPRRNDSGSRHNTNKPSKGPSEFHEVHTPPRVRREDKNKRNRCCYVTPDKRDFGQTYECVNEASIPLKSSRKVFTQTQPKQVGMDAQTSDQYHTILAEQYGFDPIIPDTISQLKELKKMLCGNSPKVENGSQYVRQKRANQAAYMETLDASQWQNMDNIEEIEKLIVQDSKDSQIIYNRIPRNVFISDVPRVKIIAEKYSKYKKNNLELRRLDEKVVCVEYNVFNKSSDGEILKPVQRMRAFFSIKPAFDVDGNNNNESLPRLPSNIKNSFAVTDDDLKNLTEKEIEIIDGKIEENKSYLEDLRRILKRKQVIKAKKNKTSLDLQSLYEMAKKDLPPLDADFSDANLLSKAELQEVKDLILHRCTSSVHGIRRRRIKRKEKGSNLEVGVISESIVAELLRDDPKLNVFQ